ncbi:MAG: hypothetical protein IT236_13655 [Bacteroidia bacterium]|nr:hypothetical protein [Bacteroidia bacterium]
MQNGKHIVVKIIVLVLYLHTSCLLAQVKDTSRFNSDWPSFKIEEECISKSERSNKPRVLKISKAKLAEVKTVKQLIIDIPEPCEVLCVLVSIKKPDDKVFEFRNIGNDMVYANRLTEGKYILIENLITSCPTLHKANYKIIIEP